MYYQNNKPLPTGRAFTLGDVQYPANWLQLSSAEDRAVLGITWVADPVRADDRFFWGGDVNMAKELNDREEVDENGDPMYVKVLGEMDGEPAMVDSDERLVTKGLKSQWTAQVKDTAGKMLAATDWMVIRKVERNVDIPAETAAFRDAVVTECNRLETAINAATTVEELITALGTANWPVTA